MTDDAHLRPLKLITARPKAGHGIQMPGSFLVGNQHRQFGVTTPDVAQRTGGGASVDLGRNCG